MRWFFIGSLLLAACGSASHPRLALDDASTDRDAPSGEIPDAISTPPLQAVILWPTGMMGPNGTLYRVTAVDVVGDFPTRFSLSLTAPPPDDVLSVYASRGWHAVMANVTAIRAGSIDASGYVAACEVWGYANDNVIYMTESGAWLQSEFGYNDPTVYSQGYHLFGLTIIDAGPCNDPMCPGPTTQLYEIPLQREIALELRDPNEWCR